MDTKDEYSTSDVAMELAIAVSRLQARMKHEAGIAERGITASQLAMLKRLDTEGELSVSTLAAYEHVSQQAITQRLELLRSTGYVTQHADSKDRRRRLVGLTDEGHAFLAHVTASQTTWLAHAIEYALDDGERGDLAAATTLIERIADGRRHAMKTADKTRETPAFPKTFIMAMIFGVGLNPVNSTLISTALAPISHDLRIDAGRATLLISALYLTCAIAQPTAGKLSEIIGPRSVFMAGAALVMIGGLLGGFAPNLGVLLTSRVLIGAGTSCGYPAAMLLVRRRADRMGLAEPPSLVLSILAMVGLVLIAVGPPLGGLLVTFLGWRSTFFVNVLVGIITIVLGLASIEPDAKHEHRMTVSFFIAHLDVMGLLLFSITISALLIVLMSLPTFDKVSGCVTVIALLAFVAWELHAATPFVDVRSLAADNAMTLNFLRAMLTMLGAYVVMYALPQWLEDACHMNAGVSGMFIIPMGVVATVASLSIAKKPIVRLPLMVCCSAMVAVGMLLACTSSAGMVVLPLTASAVAGLVLGLSMSTSQTVLYRRAASEHIGTSSGLLRTSIYIGSIGASSLSGVFFGETVTDGGLHGIGITVAVLGVAALLATVMDRTLR